MKEETHKAVVILPTYNERENIGKVLPLILKQQKKLSNIVLFILVVDDSSPDGTGEFVQQFSLQNKNVHLLTGKKEGLGAAYIRGMKYALKKGFDIIIQMDADLSHNPQDIVRLLTEITNGNDFVIGSRYVSGGSIPHNWPYIRKLNSKMGNLFARNIAGIHGVSDCTGGFRAIKAETLKKIDFDSLNVQGYAFMVSILHAAQATGAHITEVPIHFADRTHGVSKLKIKDIKEFIINAFLIRFPVLKKVQMMLIITSFILFFALCVAALIALFNARALTSQTFTIVALTLFSLFLSVQSMMSIYWMLFAWEDADRSEADSLQHTFIDPKLSFTAIVPARHEENVIGDTIQAVSAISYPESLKEVLIVCRTDDTKTIEKVNQKIAEIGKKNVKLVTFADSPINKPHSINVGLLHATKDVVVIFDAEDQPHKEIYTIVNAIMEQRKSDVVQAGVQLMNYRSQWFSTLNVLEYFFWFKSTLHFFAEKGIIPLGGNTVFFRKTALVSVGGWDEQCLTEDADIGIRLSARGAKIHVVYSSKHVTQEETPDDIMSFIKQRTRWNQGFIQVLLKRDWLKLPKLSQKILALYMLTLPEFQAATFLLIPVSVIMAATMKLPVGVALLTLFPLLLLMLQLIIYNIGLFEFTKEYKKKFPVFMPLRILATFFPFQIILGVSALRAMYRSVRNKTSWEKTRHMNAHRTQKYVKPFSLAFQNV